MASKSYLQKFAAAVVKRSGIARPTVEAILPHVFDEIRYQLTEGSLCVSIESFGTFAVIDRPEHEYLCNRGDKHGVKTVAARRQLKFRPAKNLRCEVEQGRYDHTRNAFVHHSGDPKLATRQDLRYRSVKNYNRTTGAGSRPIYKALPEGADQD